MFRIFTVLFLISSSLKATEGPSDLPFFHLIKKIVNLDWKEKGTYPVGHAHISLPENYIALLGEEAQEFAKLCLYKNDTSFNPSLDNLNMVISNYDLSGYISFEDFNVGYIPLDEWENLDSELLFTKIQNYEKVQDDFRILNWIQKPVLDKKTYTLKWILKGVDRFEDAYILTVQIKLHRFGYTKITYCIEDSLDHFLNENFDAVANSYEINPEGAYLDLKEENTTDLLEIAPLASPPLFLGD